MTPDNGQSLDQLKAENAALKARVDKLQEELDRHMELKKLARQKEEILHATLDSAPYGILAVGENGHVLFSNKHFARMWHIPPDLLEARNDDELLQYVVDQLVDPQSFLAKVRELYQSFHDSTDILHFRDGRIIERRSTPLALEGKLCGRVWTFRDISHEPGNSEGAGI